MNFDFDFNSIKNQIETIKNYTSSSSHSQLPFLVDELLNKIQKLKEEFSAFNQTNFQLVELSSVELSLAELSSVNVNDNSSINYQLNIFLILFLFFIVFLIHSNQSRKKYSSYYFSFLYRILVPITFIPSIFLIFVCKFFTNLFSVLFFRLPFKQILADCNYSVEKYSYESDGPILLTIGSNIQSDEYMPINSSNDDH